jgi:hypothetical protein
MLGLDQAIAVQLKARGIGDLYSDDPAGSIYIGEEPETPDSTVTVLLEGGGAPTLTLAEEHLVTVRVRDASYETAHERMRAVYLALHEEQGQWSGIPVARVRANFPPLTLGRDASGRWRVTQSYTVLARRFHLI